MRFDGRKVVATIEARMTSTRLPGKVLLPVLGTPLLELMIGRLRRCALLDEIVVATTVNRADDPVAALATRLGAGVHRGSEEDVLGRVVDAAEAHGADVIVELTGDCPLIDPEVVDRTVRVYLEHGYDYVSNILERTWPVGMDTQVFATRLLRQVERATRDPADREHVSLYFYEIPGRFSTCNVPSGLPARHRGLRLTVDTPEDFRLIEQIVARLAPRRPDFLLADVLALLDEHPELLEINRGVRQRSAR